MPNKTLRGIATFGFGVIIPLQLASPAEPGALESRTDDSTFGDDKEMEQDIRSVFTQGSRTHVCSPQLIGSTTPTPAQTHTQTPIQNTSFPIQQVQFSSTTESLHRHLQTSGRDVGSRRGSLVVSSFHSRDCSPSQGVVDPLNPMGKNYTAESRPQAQIQKEIQTPTHVHGHNPPQILFTEQMIKQVVQKAELGRVMMDIENI
ncbi:CYFA0S07e03763g1_1 [Cyberlindnera fabianii]|uniref:CYFA0S07e03763g1_1 n=1 Tax=Cyberlindnera fabianii TaxID=36022 RepID=A0A061AWK4_CYBFA|nr:CYFA0S07e03763g1_1 [Cyberlindnera fabianii]